LDIFFLILEPTEGNRKQNFFYKFDHMHIFWLGPRGHFSFVFYVSPLFAIDQQNLARGSSQGKFSGFGPHFGFSSTSYPDQ